MMQTKRAPTHYEARSRRYDRSQVAAPVEDIAPTARSAWREPLD